MSGAGDRERQDGFLGRWSRLKRGGEAPAAAPEEGDAPAPEAAAAEAPPLEELSDEEALQRLGLPHPDALQRGDDFKVFLQAAVPQRLKRLALRRLWAVNPLLANLDGLVDYAEDYTDAATVVPGLVTGYRVGKGMVAHVERLAAAASAETETTAAGEGSPGAPQAAAEAAGEPGALTDAAGDGAPAPARPAVAGAPEPGPAADATGTAIATGLPPPAPELVPVRRPDPARRETTSEPSADPADASAAAPARRAPPAARRRQVTFRE